MKIGFLGGGRMGMAIAGRLLDHGHELFAWNRTRDKLAPLAQRGATVMNSPAEAAEGVDAVVSMLSDDDAVSRAALGAEDGAILGLSSGRVHVSMSTIGLRTVERLAREHEARRQRFVSAPVLGRPEAAQRGELVVLAAGLAEALDACAPIFEAVGKETHRFGDDPKRANVVKLLLNFVLASMLETLGEAFTLAERSGVRSDLLLDILDGAVFKSPMFAAYGHKIVRESFVPAGFDLALGVKDVRLLLEAGEAQALPMPVASVLRDRFLQAMALGLRDKDWSAVARARRSPPHAPAKIQDGGRT
jgi:3-hydroxyisobutyrate dehydrogenase-like beta-hydroxyacid dehydrogenase